MLIDAYNEDLCTSTLVLSLDLSCSPFRAMALDTNSTLWDFKTPERPYRLVSPLLECSSPETTPIQVQCTVVFSAVLMRSGDAYLWPMHNEDMVKHRDESKKAIVPDDGTVVPCHTWEINVDLIKLPSLPDLPDLPMTGLPGEERRKKTKLIKIATCFTSVIGLTNKGHVLKADGSFGEEGPPWAWDYVSESAWIIWHLFLNRNM